jgi:hypothetical protein
MKTKQMTINEDGEKKEERDTYSSSVITSDFVLFS